MTKEGVNQEKFLKFNFKTDRLDSFLYQCQSIGFAKSDEANLWPLMGRALLNEDSLLTTLHQMLIWRKNR